LAEKQECSAKLRTCHLAALAALKEQIDSLMEENAKILTSLKGNPCVLSHDMLILMMLM